MIPGKLKFKPATIRLLYWLAGAAFFLGLFIHLTQEVYEHEGMETLDRAAMLFVSHLRAPSLNGAAVDLTALGSPTLVTIATLISLVILSLARDRLGAAFLALSVAGAGLLSLLVKNVVERPRPQLITRLVEVTGQSYPSGHSLAATSLYLALAFLACRHFKAVRTRICIVAMTICLIGLVCFSRVYLGVHYPSDVTSGFFLGTAWVLFLTAVFSRAA